MLGSKKGYPGWPNQWYFYGNYGNLKRVPHASELNLAKSLYRKSHSEELKNWIYNADEDIILGRERRTWGKVCLFYLAFYVVLAVFFTICLNGFLLTVDWNYPRVSMGSSIIWDQPGLGVRPQPFFLMNLIQFRTGFPSSYKPYVDQLEAFLLSLRTCAGTCHLVYENERQVGWRMTDCEGQSKRSDPERVCRFNLEDLGNQCIHQRQFGYETGQPCVMLKLNKIFGWEPELWDNITEYDQIPEEVRDRYDPDYIPIHCKPQYPPDVDNIKGEIRYFPPAGFKAVYYPFINQENYRVPLVMIQFTGLEQRVMVQVECRVYAKNIQYDRNRMMGSVRFEILMD